LYMVERVDVCIAFMRNHVRLSLVWMPMATSLVALQRDCREADLYLLRFQQCMTRAMTLIKMSFVGSLRALTADISKRLSEKVHLSSTVFPKLKEHPGHFPNSSTPSFIHAFPICCSQDPPSFTGTRTTSVHLSR